MNNYTDSEDPASISNAHQWSRSAENEFEPPIVHAHNPEAGTINAGILGLLEADPLAAFQFSLRHRGVAGSINYRLPLGSVVLGRGASFVVRRVLFDSYHHFDITSSTEREPDNSKFVVLKQPLASENRGPDDVKRLRAVLLEMKILRHKPIAEHPNIVRLLQLRWDTQDGPALIAPTLVLEHADLGSLAGFQDPGRLILSSDTKRTICLDIARGLQALHSCGIVHGDVKSENVLLFIDRQSGCRAKLSDFGSSLLEVIDKPNAGLRKLPGFSPGWQAPEYDQLLSPIGLLQTDIYSYGLTVWRIMLDGVEPYRFLHWNGEAKTTVLARTSIQPLFPPQNVIPLSVEEFDGRKLRDDIVLNMALATLQKSYDREDLLDDVRRLLGRALWRDLSDRCCAIGELIELLSGTADYETRSSKNSQQPEILRNGDFNIFSPKFPICVNHLKIAPPEFRGIIVAALTQAADALAQTDVEKGRRLCLALSICHTERFCVHPDPRKAVEWATKASHLGDITAQGLIKRLYDALELPIPPDLPWKSWLVASMKHGSIIGKRSLQEADSELHEQTLKSMLEEQQRCDLANRHILESHVNSGDDAFYHVFSSNWVGSAASFKLSTQVVCLAKSPLLHCASFLGHVDLCRKLLDAKVFLVDTIDEDGETALHYACKNCKKDVARVLLDYKANPNALSRKGVAPLHYAVISASVNTELIGVLLDRGADANPLSSAAYPDVIDSVACDYNCYDPGSPLHWAVARDDLSAVEALLRYGADPNLRNDFGLSPLMLAIVHRSLAIMDLLLQYIEPSTLPPFEDLLPWLGWNYNPLLLRALHAEWSNKDSFFLAIECLRQYGIQVDDKGLLCQAIDDDNVEIAEHFILKLGLGPGTDLGTYKHEYGDLHLRLESLLATAVLNCCPAMVEMTLRRLGGRIKSDANDDELTILALLAHRRSLVEEETQDIAVMLISAGADVDAIDIKSPLHHAVRQNRIEVIRVLLDKRYGPMPSDLLPAFRSCLRDGSSKPSSAILALLVKAQPELLMSPLDPSFPDSNMLYILCNVEDGERDDIINTQKLKFVISELRRQPNGLEQLRACLDYQDSLFGQTPLHEAAKWANIEAAKELLDAGADVNAHGEGFLYRTPLDEAESRDWDLRYSKFHNLPNGSIMIFAGGDAMERRAFDKRTEAMVNFLKKRGGTNGVLSLSETFSLPLLDFDIQWALRFPPSSA